MKKKILIVEDEVDIAEIMETILTTSGFEVETISSGQNISAKIKKFSPNLIFMDMWMPGLDGATLTKNLKSEKSTRDIPIVIVSAGNGLAKIAKAARADGFLAKPFDLKKLISVTKKFTSKNGLK